MKRESWAARGRGLVSYCLNLSCALAILATTLSASDAGARTLVLLVHGYGGSALIDRALKVARSDQERRDAVWGDYLGIGKALSAFIQAKNVTDVDFFLFKYDTFANSNIESARILNFGLLGGVKSLVPKAEGIVEFNQLPAGRSIEDYERSIIVTLSNGNLVLREAILQSLGVTDDKDKRTDGNKSYQKILSKLESEVRITGKDFSSIGVDERLQAFYKKATIYDISPILGGAADARGAQVPFHRHREVDPFGKRNRWLFSDENISAYDNAVEGRHFTFFIVGDKHTRGLWNYWCRSRGYTMDSLNIWGVAAQMKAWRREHDQWLKHFELSRGKDPAHHVEFVQNFESDSHCTVQQYMQGNRFLKGNSDRLSKFLAENSHNQKLLDRIAQRTQEKADFFSEIMSRNPSDYLVNEMAWIHGGDGYTKMMKRDFLNPDGSTKDPSEIRMQERHTLLVFYRPMIERVGREVFGDRFSDWYGNH